MVKKDEIIKILEDAQIAEERSIPVYTKHIGSAIFWTGIEKEKAEEIKKILKYLAEESARHKGVVEYLLKYIKEEDKDAF